MLLLRDVPQLRASCTCFSNLSPDTDEQAKCKQSQLRFPLVWRPCHLRNRGVPEALQVCISFSSQPPAHRLYLTGQQQHRLFVWVERLIEALVVKRTIAFIVFDLVEGHDDKGGGAELIRRAEIGQTAERKGDNEAEGLMERD